MIKSPEQPLPEFAELPIWHVGDRWTYQSSVGTTYTYTMTSEENFEGTPCYVLEGTCEPPYGGWGENIRVHHVKSTLALKKQLVWGMEDGVGRNRGITFTRNFSRAPWPLEVGKEHSMSWTKLVEYLEGGEGWSDPQQQGIYIVRVENREGINVSAGTFVCFKLVTYDGDVKVETAWYSPEVKREVKRADYTTGENIELISYQVG